MAKEGLSKFEELLVNPQQESISQIGVTIRQLAYLPPDEFERRLKEMLESGDKTLEGVLGVEKIEN